MQLTLLAFQGLGRHPKYQAESGLIQIGHVGLSFIEEELTIYGFHPTAEAVIQAGGEEGLLARLRSRIRQPGIIQIDTVHFLRAHELAQHGVANHTTEVVALVYDLPDEDCQRMHTQIQDWQQTGREFWYNFPQRGKGLFNPDEYNCATFPSLLGLNLPTNNGLIRPYVQAMRDAGGIQWQPPGQP